MEPIRSEEDRAERKRALHEQIREYEERRTRAQSDPERAEYEEYKRRLKLELSKVERAKREEHRKRVRGKIEKIVDAMRGDL